MSIFKTKNIPIALMCILGLFFLFIYYIPIQATTNVGSGIRGWVTVISTFTVFLGTISIMGVEYTNIRKKGLAWQSSIWFIILFFVTVLTFFYSGGAANQPYSTFFNTIFGNLDAAIWATLAFMIAGALFRVFRARSWEALLLIVACIFVILTNATFGGAIWAGFPQIGNWILQVPSGGSSKASTITAAVAAIILGMRILLGYEKRLM